jgi:alanyl-tRNA synthetase
LVGKEELRERFSREPSRYYEVELFRTEGFVRKRCPRCGKYYWTLDPDRATCPDQPCQPYTFIGNPPTRRRFDYIQSWRAIEDFFVRNGHTSIPRYPVVCRWRPDLYFTVASIVDFQRVEGGRVIFEFPANPLVVPQICLRFNDTDNVGLTGRHYTSFCMIGQHALADGKGSGYWKDRTIELDFQLLTEAFGIPREEVVFVEDVWLGYGAFGYSLEYFVRGLELGNAVFTEFEGTPDNYRVMGERVVDMGAGLERFAWLSYGTPTSYDVVFKEVLDRMMAQAGLRIEYEKMTEVVQAIALNEEPTAGDALSVAHALYTVADHARTLAFAVADGALPSNVAGGYNLRVVFRRAQGILERYSWPFTLAEVAEWHIAALKPIYPELAEHVDDVRTIIGVELERWRRTKRRIAQLLQQLKASGRRLTTGDLLKLYDSEGVTPEAIVEAGIKVEVPADFYARVTELHASQPQRVEPPKFGLEGLPPTRKLYYEDPEISEFEAEVLAVIEGRYVVLDQTAFYPRGGGQEPDRGRIDGCEVVDVEKYGDVVLHQVRGEPPRPGQRVKGQIDRRRREIIMRHHTATHIVNGAARTVLGPWVWQNSAFKDVDGARLDITHYAHLDEEQVMRIERVANEVVWRNIPVRIEELPRIEAETRYGFRIYQGGVVPGRKVRVVNIGDWDVEACGGTHCRSTGEVGLIKIVRAERVQDGVERLEYVAGEKAIEYLQEQERRLSQVSRTLESPLSKVVKAAENLKREVSEARRAQRSLLRRVAPLLIDEALKEAKGVGDIRVFVDPSTDLDEEVYIALGEELIRREPRMVYVAFRVADSSVRLYVFAGEVARRMGVKAGILARAVAKAVGGSGGGDDRFAQGGGKAVDRVDQARAGVPAQVAAMVEAVSR